MKRLMISAMASGSGKTVLTCGLLAALTARGHAAQALKCGPDYIDPMFHEKVLGVPSRNLDLFLQGEDGVRRTLLKQKGDYVVVEGAMGFYDGVNGTDRASAWQVARTASLPVVLAIRPGGSSLTLAAQVKGLLTFRADSQIRGLVLTACRPSLYAHLAPILEEETGLPVLGYLPPMEEANIGSRHLGLLTPGEIADLNQRFRKVAEQLEKTVNLDALWALAEETEKTAVQDRPRRFRPRSCCAIGVAWDAAFCFYYADNLDALRDAGAELVFFSPLQADALPEVDGLYLGGGYPEVYAQALFRQAGIRSAIRVALRDGMPTVAECGGFLYLQEQLQTEQEVPWPMVEVLPGMGYPTRQLRRFGYLTLQAERDSLLFRAGRRFQPMNFTIGTAPKLERRFWPKNHRESTGGADMPQTPFMRPFPISILGEGFLWRNALCQRQRPIGKGNRDDLEGDLGENPGRRGNGKSAGAPALGQSGQALGELGHFGRGHCPDCGADRDSGGLFEESGTGGAVRGQWSGQPGGQPV